MDNCPPRTVHLNLVVESPHISAETLETAKRIPRRTAFGLTFGRIVLIFAGLFLGLVAAEIGLRVTGYEGMQERVSTVFHDDLGQVPADAWVNNAVFDPRGSNHVVINQQKVAFKKRESQTRLVFVGDSGTAGVGVEHDEAFPLVFGNLEGSRGIHDLEIVNAGVVGMTSVGEYRLLADRIVKIHPDIVVLGIFMANDINFNLGNRHLLGEQPSWWRTLWVRLRGRSALAHFSYFQLLALDAKFGFFGAFDATSPEEAWPITLTDDSGINMIDYLGGEIATYKKWYSPLMEYAFELLREILWRFMVLAEKEGFQFVVAVIPTASQIADELEMFFVADPLEDLRQRGINISEDDFDFQKPMRRVRNICMELAIVCIDPTVAMRRIGAANAIIPRDDHLSVEGHRILAESLVRHFDARHRQFTNCPKCPDE